MIFIGRYKEAITHSSFVFEQKKKGKNTKENHNERLEFLGDSVLQLCLAQLLFREFPEFSEGEMTRILHQLADNTTLSQLARQLNLGSIIRIGKGEERGGGRERDRMLANVFEALLGAVFLEQGIGECQKIIDAQFAKIARKIAYQVPAKQILMEWSQKTYQGKVPEYRSLGHRGKDHQRIFIFGVWVDGKMVAQGEGRSKKQAQIAAAEKAVGVLRVGGTG